MQQAPRVLLMNPIEEGQTYVVDVDPVISRHTGGKTKIGVFFPLGLTYIAAVLRENSIPVTILDPIPEGHTFESALAFAQRFDVVIIALAASNARGAYRFFSRLQGKTRILMGTHAAALADYILKNGYCDIVVRGEPEYTILESIKNQHALASVQGISYRSGNAVVKNPDRPTITDLDKLPFPARDLVDNTKYHIVSFPGRPTALVLTSRGCPFSCTYCATHLFYKRRRTVRSPEHVVREVEHIVTTYNITNIFFADDTFNIDEKRVLTICALLQEKKLPIQWLCLGRVDTMTEPMIRAMAAAGCKEILYGIESASPEVQRHTKKNITVQQMKQAVSLTLKA
ncbi:MAG: radical SAM protein, partial [Pseudomonadota bacterium]